MASEEAKQYADVLQRVAVCCSVLQCVAVRCSCCNDLLRLDLRRLKGVKIVCRCVAVCCSVLQCVAVRCSVLQLL